MSTATEDTAVDVDVVPLGQPRLRIWELDDTTTTNGESTTATRYDRLIAAPSDETLYIMWVGLSSAAFILFAFCLLVFVAILKSKDCHTNTWNIYLLYLMIPDIVGGILCGTTCALNASLREYWSPWMCRFQSTYIVWYIVSNSYLCTIVGYKIYAMLTSSIRRRRFIPPTVMQITKEAIIVYIFATFVSIWTLFETKLLPYQPDALSGEICLPTEYNKASTIFYFVAYVPLSAGIPMIYLTYVCFDIWYRNLMPPKGKRRLLSIYFARILGSFFLLWTPYLLATWLAGGKPWVMWTTSIWGHLQGAISAGLSLLKPDIKQGFDDFIGRYFLCRSEEQRYEHRQKCLQKEKNKEKAAAAASRKKTSSRFVSGLNLESETLRQTVLSSVSMVSTSIVGAESSSQEVENYLPSQGQGEDDYDYADEREEEEEDVEKDNNNNNNKNSSPPPPPTEGPPPPPPPPVVAEEGESPRQYTTSQRSKWVKNSTSL